MMPIQSSYNPNETVARGHEHNLMVIAPNLGAGTVGAKLADRVARFSQKPGKIAGLCDMHACIVAKPADTLARSVPPKAPFQYVRDIEMIIEPVVDTGNFRVPPVSVAGKASRRPENAGSGTDRGLVVEPGKTKIPGSVLPKGQVLSDGGKRQRAIGPAGYARADWPLGFGDMMRNMGRGPSSERGAEYGDSIRILRKMVRKLGFLAAAVVLFTRPVVATEHEVGDYGSVLEGCYGSAADPAAQSACIGQMSRACMDSQDGGHTTLGMSSCLGAEADVWDLFLNVEYLATMALSKVADEGEAEFSPAFANRVESLRAAQRAWIAFRDAECSLAYAQWGSGSMRNIAGADCRMKMTAKRTLELRDMREMFE